MGRRDWDWHENRKNSPVDIMTYELFFRKNQTGIMQIKFISEKTKVLIDIEHLNKRGLSMKSNELSKIIEPEVRPSRIIFPIVWAALIPFLPLLIPLAGVLLGFVIYLIQKLLFGEAEYQ